MPTQLIFLNLFEEKKKKSVLVEKKEDQELKEDI